VERLAWSWSFWIAAALSAFALSAVSTWLAIGYAKRRRLIDEPGMRRSHSTPTPRGGGIGIVVAVLALACIPALMRPPTSVGAVVVLTTAILIVAAVGWIDDHRGLSARTRFAAHCIAAIIFLLPVIAAVALSPDALEENFATKVSTVWLSLVLIVLGIVWFVNLHNFMDGIDGILAAQAIFVLGALALLCRHVGEPHAGQVLVFAAAAAGFLPFNFPRARIFMGDVGSGVLGLLIAAAVLWQMSAPDTAISSGLVLCSAFVTDATATLVSRIARGRRWYSAHREHLYQWLVRSGFSHAGVVALYMGWNLVIALPVVAFINRAPGAWMPIANANAEVREGSGLGAAVLVYALGAVVWMAGKRWCLGRERQRRQHAAA
jgi:UDP-N-acetylmuramyl pentapeptide phosphotransferase/UDP-N-acetylglucosamine-1-phosphate transferase